ncbi:MAG: glycosyltransferase family 87 protein [Anaerolineaceae bacterium]
MHRKNKAIISIIGIIVILGLLGGLTWANYRFSVSWKGGNEFITNWMGTRLFLTEGQSPYSEQTSSQIQMMAYGHLAKNNEKALIFTSPLYSIILFAPFALIPDFNLACAIWMTLLEAALIGIVFFSIRISDWKPGPGGLLFFTLFAFLWFYSAYSIISGDVIIITTFFIVLGIWAIKAGEWEFAGVAFAISTIKPQYAIVFIIILLIWTLAIRQYKFAIWFISSLVFFTISAVLLQPDWILQSLHAGLQNLASLNIYNPATALAALLPGVGTKIGWALSGVILAMIIIEWVRARKPDERKLTWLIYFTLVGAAFIGLPIGMNSFIMLLPVLPVIFCVIDERWRKAGVPLNSFFYIILLFGIWLIYLSTKGNAKQTAILFFPAASLLFILMYWIRNWVMNSVRPWYDLAQDEMKRFR